MTTNDQIEIGKRVIAKAWSSPEFKKVLIEKPNETFAKEGLDISEPIRVSEVEKGDKIFFLPKPPGDAATMSMDSLQAQAASLLARDAEMF